MIRNRKFNYRPDFVGYGSTNVRFSWLNEAVTSMLETGICESIGLDPEPCYEREQLVTMDMIKKSQLVDFKMLADAYFEDFHPFC